MKMAESVLVSCIVDFDDREFDWDCLAWVKMPAEVWWSSSKKKLAWKYQNHFISSQALRLKLNCLHQSISLKSTMQVTKTYVSVSLIFIEKVAVENQFGAKSEIFVAKNNALSRWSLCAARCTARNGVGPRVPSSMCLPEGADLNTLFRI